MKYIPNILSVIRIALSLLLLSFNYGDFVFISTYLICGITDVLDDFIARKYNAQSIVGAKLDSFVDMFMFGVITFIVVTQAENLNTMLMPLILIVIMIRIINIIICFFKYKTFVIIHTWGNKLSGLLVFAIPLLLDNIICISLIAVIAIISSIEELIIHLFTNKLDINRKSLFFN